MDPTEKADGFDSDETADVYRQLLAQPADTNDERRIAFRGARVEGTANHADIRREYPLVETDRCILSFASYPSDAEFALSGRLTSASIDVVRPEDPTTFDGGDRLLMTRGFPIADETNAFLEEGFSASSTSRLRDRATGNTTSRYERRSWFDAEARALSIVSERHDTTSTLAGFVIASNTYLETLYIGFDAALSHPEIVRYTGTYDGVPLSVVDCSEFTEIDE